VGASLDFEHIGLNVIIITGVYNIKNRQNCGWFEIGPEAFLFSYRFLDIDDLMQAERGWNLVIKQMIFVKKLNIS
jgi:hypothetical protein